MKLRLLQIMLLVCSICVAQGKWAGKRAAILGDSISDSVRVGTKHCWWETLGDSLGMETICYAKNGWQINGLRTQAEWALKEQEKSGKKFDLILLFGGTNDFNGSIPLGEFFTLKQEEVNRDGKMVQLLHRYPSTDDGTFCGRLNNLLSYLKQHFPETRIVMLTPIHRAYAKFGDNNVQPDELWANLEGLFLEDYIREMERASHIWAVPCMDLNVECELFPLYSSYDGYFNKVDTDRLHPNTAGHERMARVIQSYLESHYPF